MSSTVDCITLQPTLSMLLVGMKLTHLGTSMVTCVQAHQVIVTMPVISGAVRLCPQLQKNLAWALRLQGL
jgi:hypothetical protein